MKLSKINNLNNDQIFDQIWSRVWSQVRYQVMNTGFPIHTDKYSRRVAINYLLELGGSNVLTQVYDGNNEVLESQRIDLHRWHYLIAELPHNATPIETPRAAISVILKTQEEVPFFKRIDYKPVT
jgi:hypothetical protein